MTPLHLNSVYGSPRPVGPHASSAASRRHSQLRTSPARSSMSEEQEGRGGVPVPPGWGWTSSSCRLLPQI
jgi:hypothetical protein